MALDMPRHTPVIRKNQRPAANGNVILRRAIAQRSIPDLLASQESLIRHIAFQYRFSPHDAEDIIQDTAVRTLEHQHLINWSNNPQQFILQTATNICRGKLRHKRVEDHYLQSAKSVEVQEKKHRQPHAPVFDYTDEVLARWRHQLTQMSPNFRRYSECMLARIHEGKSISPVEIAKELGLTDAASYSQWERLRKLIRKTWDVKD